MLLYTMLYIVLAYLMLFAALTNSVCLNNASFFFLFKYFLCQGYELSGEIALKTNHYYYYYYSKVPLRHPPAPAIIEIIPISANSLKTTREAIHSFLAAVVTIWSDINLSPADTDDCLTLALTCLFHHHAQWTNPNLQWTNKVLPVCSYGDLLSGRRLMASSLLQ